MLRYLVLAALFYVLTPGILLSLPKGGSKQAVALTHAIVFVAVYYLLEKLAEMFKLKKKEKKLLKEKFDDDDDYEGFQLLGSKRPKCQYGHEYNNKFKKCIPLSPVELALREYNDAAGSCESIKEEKNYHYRMYGDNNSEFRELDRIQGLECDRMNNAANRLNDLGVGRGELGVWAGW